MRKRERVKMLRVGNVITLRTLHGKTTGKVTAALPDLVVVYRKFTEEYSVTHIPTGLAAIQNVPTKEQAEEALWSFASLPIDWATKDQARIRHYGRQFKPWIAEITARALAVRP